MAGRFLTPAKITLLALAQIYTKGQVPWSSTSTVLNLLINRIVLDAADQDEVLLQDDSDSILVLEQALAGQQSLMPGKSMWDLLLEHIWSIRCSDDLDDFIGAGPQLLGKTRDQLLQERDEGVITPAGKVVRTSPLGAFIRRSFLEWHRLQFHDSMTIWTDFVAYRMPSKAAFLRKHPQAVHNAFDANFDDLGIDPSHPMVGIMFRPLLQDADQKLSFTNNYDTEKLMEFQVSEMQSFGGRLPEIMRTKLRQMAKEGAAAPKLSHYLSFLDSWRAGDFTSAFDNLHRYFDYTMQSRERTFYQYALLNLAILQADFGCYDEAIPAMQEAIATARENRDSVCLNYCMSWLYHFGRAFPSQMQAVRDTGILGDEIEGLNFLKSRAKDAEMWTLLSTSHLSEAKIWLQRGDSMAACFENVVKAAHINIVKGIPNSTGPALLMKTSLFSRLGQTHMAQSCGERFLLCRTNQAPLEDVLKCTVRQASFFAQIGRPQQAQELFDTMPDSISKVLKYKTYHDTTASIIRARRLLHRDSLTAASDIIDQLVAQQPHPELDTTTQVSLLEIDLLTRKKEYSSAVLNIEALEEKVANENNDLLMKTKLMVMKANLLAKSDKPHQGFSLVMRAVDSAYKSRMLVVLWEALMALAHILNASYEFVAAKDLLLATLPHVLESLDCEVIGKCYLVLADSYVGMAGTLVTGTKTRSEANADAKGKHKEANDTDVNDKKEPNKLMNTAYEMLEKSEEQFRWIEELDGQLESLAKRSSICSWCGDMKTAEEIGDKYMALIKEYAEDKA